MAQLLSVSDEDLFDFDPLSRHPNEGEKLHVMLMVIKVLCCLDLGFLPLDHLQKKNASLIDIFSAPMIATGYYILMCYFLTNGKEIPSGSQCKYGIMT